jgi:drug/metabolite transporter (DMT)-like permease
VPPRQQLDLATTAAAAVAVIAVSSSGPLAAYAVAPALAIAFWRNGISAVLLCGVSAVRRRAEIRALFSRPGRRTLTGCVLAGVFLAAHFGTFVPSVKLTEVADGVALGATQPVWQGLIAHLQGRRLGRATWIGIGVAVAGAFAATGADVAVSSRAVLGDVLALIGGVAAAAYTACGERVRTETTTLSYTTICYSVCAICLGLVCLVGRVPLHGFDARAWLCILALVIGAQLLGHSLFSYALHRISATAVSMLLLLEVPGAALLAWAWLGQTPPAAAIPGLVLLLAGVAVVVIGDRRARLDERSLME